MLLRYDIFEIFILKISYISVKFFEVSDSPNDKLVLNRSVLLYSLKISTSINDIFLSCFVIDTYK